MLPLLILDVSALGQNGYTFKDFFDAVAGEKENSAQIEQSLSIRDNAFAEMAATLNDPAAGTVRKVFDCAWEAELKMATLVYFCKSGANQIRRTAETALEYKQITSDQSAAGIKLAEHLEQLAKAGELKPEQLAIHARMFAYSFRESERVMAELKKAANLRTKAANKLDGSDETKKKVYAERMLTAHTKVMTVAEQAYDLYRILWHADYEFTDGRLTEKQYDKAKRLVEKLKAIDELKWTPKDQLAIYRQATDDSATVSYIMK